MLFSGTHYQARNSTLEEISSLRLPLRMYRIPRMCAAKDDAIFHVLPSCTVQDLHPVSHVPDTPRLACVMVNMNEDIQWDTLALSDFIRPGKEF
jgi:hypothetical protein